MAEREEKPKPTQEQIMAANSLKALLGQEQAMEIAGYRNDSENGILHFDKRVNKRIEEAGSNLSQEIIVNHKAKLDEIRKNKGKK